MPRAPTQSDPLDGASSLPWRTALAATALAGGVAWLVLAQLPSAGVWGGLTPGDCREYCEASLRCGSLADRAAVHQPLNAWSNLAYLFVGVLAWRRPLRATAGLFLASCTLLAVGSFLFHAAVTREFQWLDMVGTYGVLVAVAARGWAVAFGLAEAVAVSGALALDVLIAVFKWRLDPYVALPALMGLVAVPMVRRVRGGRQSARHALVPLALFLAAFAFRQTDMGRQLCFPESAVFSGHALWHVLTAASLAGAWFFFDPPVQRDGPPGSAADVVG